MDNPSVIILGGYGVFGGHVARELVRRGIPVAIAGRDRRRAEDFAHELGSGCRGLEADVTSLSGCQQALRDMRVAVNCAGPFSQLGPALLDACLEVGCHYADITDDRRYAALVRERHAAFQDRGLTAAYGCSSMPGITTALAIMLREGMPQPPVHARVTLLIGNRNLKGTAAVTSCIEGLDRPIAAPQGTLYGFRQREVVPLPPPFGPRGVYNFESPDYDLLPEAIGVRSVVAKVGFELRLATYGLAALAALGIRPGPRFARVLRWLATPFNRFGCSGGAWLTELFTADGHVHRAALVANEDGQRAAILPCVFAVQRLLGTISPVPRGARAVHELLSARELIELLVAEGLTLLEQPTRA